MLTFILLLEESKEENDELKYMYAIIQVFANDGMESLKGILQVIYICYIFCFYVYLYLLY